MPTFINGRTCQLGWGMDPVLSRFIKVDESPKNVQEIQSSYFDIHYPSDVNCNKIAQYTRISCLIGPSVRNFFDNCIVFDSEEYWNFRWYVVWKAKKCDLQSSYPQNATHGINKIDYGIDTYILLPKKNFPSNAVQVKNLISTKQLSQVQKETKCKALVNFKEVKEMTVEELLNFMDKKEGDGAPVFAHYEEIRKLPTVIIKNEENLNTFLSYIYFNYRKIEMKLKTAGYPDIIEINENQKYSFAKIGSKLEKFKEEFENTDKSDYFKVYQVFKKLFHSYMKYLDYCMENRNSIDEGEYLPGQIEELAILYRNLNNWHPVKIGNSWRNFKGKLIATPPGYNEVIQTLKKIKKFQDCEIITEESLEEPWIMSDFNETSVFGFIDMSGATPDPNTRNQSSRKLLFNFLQKSSVQNSNPYFDIGLIVLNSECPLECSKVPKKWICLTCGDFVAGKFIGYSLLICSCGSKRQKDHLFICHHQNHQKFTKNQETPSLTQRSSSLNPDISAEKSGNLTLIKGQLEKMQRHVNDPIITETIEALEQSNDDEIHEHLLKLANLTLDGDTENLLKEYFAK